MKYLAQLNPPSQMYQPPYNRSERNFFLLKAVSGMPLAIGLLGLSFNIHQFKEIFSNFGQELPLLSRLVVSHGFTISIVLFLMGSLVPANYIADLLLRRDTSSQWFWLCIIVSAVAFAVVLLALYLPVLGLGAVQQ